MKARLLVVTIFLLAAVFAIRLPGQNSSPGPGLSTDMFDVVPPSEPFRWGLSRQAQRLLAFSPQANAQFLVGLAGGTISSPGNASPNQQVDFETRQLQGGGACGASFGTKFNLEPATGDPALNIYHFIDESFGSNAVLTTPLRKDEESVDFLPNAGLGGSDVIVEAHNDFRGFFGFVDPNRPGTLLNGSVTGVEVHIANSTGTADCTPSYEMGTPQVASPLVSGDILLGFGDPVVKANPTNGNIYVADLHAGSMSTAVGVFKTTGSTLTSCQPVGTTNEGDPTACLPVHVLVNPLEFLPRVTTGRQGTVHDAVLNVSPDMAVDERPSGIGAGDVYITGSQLDFSHIEKSGIGLEVCDSTLTKCSPYGIVSNQQGFAADLPNVQVRSDGGISITYVVTHTNFIHQSFGTSLPITFSLDIMYISCTPNGAPNFPQCRVPQLITTETQPLNSTHLLPPDGSLAGNLFPVFTHAVHDNRDDFSGTKTYVVWAACHETSTNFSLFFSFVCPKADLKYAFADTTGNSMAPKWQGPFTFDADPGHQFMPMVRTDASRGIVNVAYYTGVDDLMYLHRYKVTLRQILPGSDAPTPPLLSGMLSVDPSGNFNEQNASIGDCLGVAGRGGRAYIGFTYNNDPGVLPNDAGTAAITLTAVNNHLTSITY